jgi:hypothetical protein
MKRNDEQEVMFAEKGYFSGNSQALRHQGASPLRPARSGGPNKWRRDLTGRPGSFWVNGKIRAKEKPS